LKKCNFSTFPGLPKPTATPKIKNVDAVLEVYRSSVLQTIEEGKCNCWCHVPLPKVMTVGEIIEISTDNAAGEGWFWLELVSFNILYLIITFVANLLS
jgi:hypothetical protein